jgi:hypothetical protein
MKYMLLIHQGDAPTPRDPEAWSRLSEEEQKAVYADYRTVSETPGVSPGLQLAPPETATTVRVEDGKTLTTDGPFVATKEALGGWFLFEAEDLDAAIQLASRISATSTWPRKPLRRRSRSRPSAGRATERPPIHGPGW